MMNVRRTAAALSAAALMLLGTVFVQTASAVVLACGATVSVDTTLTADIGPCTGTAITVIADNVTLNLNGRRVFGVAGTSGEGPGIYLSGVTGSKVINGRVTDFDTGVYLEFGGRNTVQGVTVLDNIGPITGGGIFGEGIQVYTSDNNVLTRNQAIHNGTFGGITVFDSVGTVITSNLVQGNNIAENPSVHTGGPFQEDIGILVFSIDRDSDGTIITDNQVTGNGLDGISVGNFTLNSQVLRNQVTNNGFGQTAVGVRDGAGIRVGAAATGNVVASNRVYNSGGDGIAVLGTSNTIRSNQVSGSDRGVNRVTANFDMFDNNSNCDNNVWTANTFLTRNRTCIN